MFKRTFIALPIPVSNTLLQEIEFFRLNLKGLNIKWVEIQNLHLTLAFLGNTSVDQIEAVKTTLQGITSRYKPITLTLSKAGAFKSLMNPQVLWIGIQADSTLSELYDEIQNSIALLGFEPDRRPYKPHLTIGRIKSFQENNLKTLVQSRNIEMLETLKANSIVYFESLLSSSGPVYRPFEKYILK